MKSFVIFNDSRAFKQENVWNLGEVLDKFQKSELEKFGFGKIKVIANNDKELQTGFIVDAHNENDARNKIRQIKERIKHA